MFAELSRPTLAAQMEKWSYRAAWDGGINNQPSPSGAVPGGTPFVAGPAWSPSEA